MAGRSAEALIGDERIGTVEQLVLDSCAHRFLRIASPEGRV
jgi:hypothetical protein